MEPVQGGLGAGAKIDPAFLKAMTDSEKNKRRNFPPKKKEETIEETPHKDCHCKGGSPFSFKPFDIMLWILAVYGTWSMGSSLRHYVSGLNFGLFQKTELISDPQ